MRLENSNQKYVNVRKTPSMINRTAEIVYPLKNNRNIRRKREGGGAWYDVDLRRAFTQPFGGIFDLVVLTMFWSDINGWKCERADDKYMLSSIKFYRFGGLAV